MHHPVEDESTKELIRDFAAEGKRLLREEVKLMRLEAQSLLNEGRSRLETDLASAKDELTREAKSAGKAGGVIAGGGVLAQAALYLLLFALVFALAKAMPLWAATLIVAAVAGGGAAFLVNGGLNRIKRVRLAPRRTVQHLREDKQWMRDKMRALKSTTHANA